MTCVLLRRRIGRTSPSRGPPGPVGLPGRRVGRSRAAVPGGAEGADAAGRGAGGGGRGGRVPGGRAGVHAVGDPCRTYGRRGGVGRTAPGRTPPDRVSGRTLLRPPFGGGVRGRGRRGDTGAGGPHGRRGPLGLRRRAARGHRAGRAPVGQPRGRHRAAGGRGGAGVPGGRGAAAGGRGAVAGLGAGRGRLVAARRQRAQVGRALGGRATRGAQGRPVRAPRPGGRAGVGAGTGLREHPGRRGGRGVPARGAGRGGPGGAAAAGADGADSDPGAAAGAGRGGGGRSAAAAAGRRHLLVSLCRRGDPAARAGPGGLRGVLRLLVHQQHADPQPCAEGDGGAQRGQCARVAAAGHGRGGRGALPGRAAGRGGGGAGEAGGARVRGGRRGGRHGRGRPRQALPHPGHRTGEGVPRGAGGRHRPRPVGRRGGPPGHSGLVRDAGPGVPGRGTGGRRYGVPGPPARLRRPGRRRGRVRAASAGGAVSPGGPGPPRPPRPRTPW
ncbi:hypothetical protein SGPA1_31149 [Streptomyces misionensis JCM 4497]